MLISYIKIAFRNLTRNLVYSVINISGLSIGIATSLLIMLWVVDEISYDRIHKNLHQLYSVITNVHLENGVETWQETPYLVYDELKTWPNQFKNVSISSGQRTILLSVDENGFNKLGSFVSPEFLKMFRFELVKGNRDQVLDDPFSVVLTETTAKTLFGDVDPIDKMIKLNNKVFVKVTGIFKDVPGNSSVNFDFLLPFNLFEKVTPWVRGAMNDIDATDFETYVELNAGVDAELVNSKINGLIKEHTQLSKELFLYPMARWHLHNHFKNGKEDASDMDDRGNRVTEFSIIAIGVLLIACINFMNLATARAERRAREVGIRKTVGSRRKELIVQFLGESVLMAAISFVIALAITELLLPLYSSLVQKKLFIDYSSPMFWFYAVVMILIIGLFSGSYPAFYLSSFKPAKILKGNVQVGNESILPRKILVTSQFAFSIFLIAGTIVVYQQMEFGRDRQLGYDKQFLITVPNKDLKKTYATIKNELLRTGLVVSSTKSNNSITEVYGSNFLKLTNGVEINTLSIEAEYDYLKTMGIKLIAGRDFKEGVKSDTAAVILNQAAVELLGLKNPIGHKATIAGKPMEIIGVTENVLMQSPYEEIKPLYMVLETKWNGPWSLQNITIRLQPTKDIPSAIKKVEAVFKKYNPGYPFEYSFADNDFNKKFEEINLIGRLVNVFAFMAIFIACLGLFGLAAFTAELRTKEFGVRKILGANVSQLVSLISNDFVKLIGVSFILSAPITWWVLTNYLERYPLRVSLNWLILPAAGIVVLVIALIIVSGQAIKVAQRNPVESLRSE
jgi:putative ABC transport system permease protein